MSRRKNSEAKVELGVVAEPAVLVEDNSIYETFTEDDDAVYSDRSAIVEDEEIAEEDTGSVISGTITRVGNGSVWMEIAGCGYEVSKECVDPALVKGDTVTVIYQGTPGSADFMIVGAAK